MDSAAKSRFEPILPKELASHFVFGLTLYLFEIQSGIMCP